MFKTLNLVIVMGLKQAMIILFLFCCFFRLIWQLQCLFLTGL